MPDNPPREPEGVALEPCRFCTMPVLRVTYVRATDEVQWWCVECVNCSCQGPTSKVSEAHAVELWNTRPQPYSREVVAGLVEALQATAEEIEQGDIYKTMCCSGHDCGCLGASHADFLLYNIGTRLTTARQWMEKNS